MICSAVYVASALLCSAISSPLATYSLMFLVSFALIFLHDLVEESHRNHANIFSVILSFTAYLIISVALFIKNTELFSNTVLSSEIYRVVLIAVAVICAVLLKIKPNMPPFIASVFMLINAIVLGVALQNSGDAKMQAASCAVILGALSLTVSNAINFFDQNERKSLLRINLYYFGLMFISCSIAVL